MSPAIYQQAAFRFDFNSREEDRMHVHVESPDGKAKFWLEPFVALADFRDLKQHELKEIQRLVESNEEQSRDGWNEHFPG